jgi:hypothetical protein
MPTMVGLKDSKHPEITIKYVCTDCAWVYYIENPKVGSVAAHEHKTALAWYAKHRCSDFPYSPHRRSSSVDPS